MQNKANFLNDKTNANTVAAKSYENKPPLPHSKKQTQFKPNSSPKLELCSTLSEVEGPIEPNSPFPYIKHNPDYRESPYGKPSISPVSTEDFTNPCF
jgi:hypothetical protein